MLHSNLDTPLLTVRLDKHEFYYHELYNYQIAYYNGEFITGSCIIVGLH
jgi:hypothetical protein